MQPIFVFTDHHDVKASRANDLDSYHEARLSSLFAETCPFCRVDCATGEYETPIMDAAGEFQTDRLSVCERCGWWSYDNDDPDPYLVSHWSSRALLKTFAVGDFDVPVTELARYLQEHEDAMSMVHPAKFEELVGSVFSSYFGYRVDYCSYGRPDLGIDLVVLNTDENKPIALQVKRYRAPIELGQIHQFFGALVDSGYKQGVFVTSGRFRSGASAATGRLNANSEITIDLLDGKKFLEFIAVTNSQARSVYENVLSSITKATGRVQTARIVESMRERSRSTSAREER